LCSCRERERDRSRERERERERERSLERERERERERGRSLERERERVRELERSREGDRERQRGRDRDRDSRREARASPGAINDSSSMRRNDVCLFLSICYHAKFCTIIGSMWIIFAAVSATVDSLIQRFALGYKQQSPAVAFALVIVLSWVLQDAIATAERSLGCLLFVFFCVFSLGLGLSFFLLVFLFISFPSMSSALSER
jgi:E3 ubiquitin-protein ligase RBBP6